MPCHMRLVDSYFSEAVSTINTPSDSCKFDIEAVLTLLFARSAFISTRRKNAVSQTDDLTNPVFYTN
jgi:hypothetical protein